MARIAHDLLAPEVLSKADKMLSHLSHFTRLEGPFFESFADEINSRGWNDQSGLHYVNIPFSIKATTEPTRQTLTTRHGLS